MDNKLAQFMAVGPKNITIRKIGTDLKLPVSTVSKALGDSHEISPGTKKKVLDYAEKFNFVPNTYASSLKKRKTGNIAVVLPEVADSFFSSAISGIESIAQSKKYHVIIYLTHEDHLREQSILKSFRSGRVDGVLLSVSNEKSSTYIQELQETKIPIVLFDRVCEDIETSQVATDDFDSSYKATEHLIKKGCTQIAFLSMTEKLAIINNRLNGYKKALTNHGMKIQNQNIVHCTNQESTNYVLVKKLLSKKNRPDGIIGSVEKLVPVVYNACLELKLIIPRDVKIIGFSNLNIASLLNPSLTTITQPAFEIGKIAASILSSEMEATKKNEQKFVRIVIPSILSERTSTQ